jgi:hypothetical protein
MDGAAGEERETAIADDLRALVVGAEPAVNRRGRTMIACHGAAAAIGGRMGDLVVNRQAILMA